MVINKKKLKKDIEKMRKEYHEYHRNYLWFNSHYNCFEQYKGKYIAVFNEKIVGISKSKKYLENKCKDMVGVYIDYIPEKDVIWV